MNFDEEVARLRISPALFLSESLFELIKLFHSNEPAPVAMRSLFQNANDVLPYEDVWQRIFMNVLRTYPNRSARFQYLAKQADLHQQLVSMTRAKLSGSLPHPIFSLQLLRRRAIPQAQYIESNNRRGKVDLDPEQEGYLVHLYFDIRHRLQALHSVPIFVSFYNLLFSSLSHRITEEQAQEFTVPAAIAYLEKCFEAQNVKDACDVLRGAWTLFKEKWNVAVENIHHLRLCANAEAFEGQLEAVSDDTKLMSLLSTKSSSIGQLQFGSITRLIKDLLDTQRDIVEAAERASGETGLRLGERLDLSFLTHGADFSLILFGSDFSERTFDAYASCCARIDEDWKETSLVADLPRLSRFLISRAYGKVKEFDCARIELPFPFAVVEIIDSAEEGSAKAEQGAEDFADRGGAIHRLLIRLCAVDNLSFLRNQEPLSEDERRRLDLALKECSGEAELIELGRALLRLLQEMKSADEDGGISPHEYADKTVDKLIREWFSGADHVPQVANRLMFPFAKLKDIANNVCINWFTRDLEMFTDVSALFSIPFKVIKTFRSAFLLSPLTPLFYRRPSIARIRQPRFN